MADWSESELARALGELVADVSDPAVRRASILAGGRRRLRRRRRALALGTAAVLVVVGTGAGIGVSRGSGGGAAGTLVATTPTVPVSTPPPSAAPTVTPTGVSSDAATAPPPYTPSPVAPLPSRQSLEVSLTSPIVVVDSQGIALLSGHTRVELTGTARAEFPGLSHDRRYLSWLSPTGDTTELHVRDLSSGTETMVADIGSYAWSPVADVVARCGPDGLSVGGPTAVVVKTLPGDCFYPVWSPDGQRLAAPLGKVTTVVTADLSPVATLPYAIRVARFVGNGLLLWPDPSFSGSIAADGLELTDINLSTLQAFPVATTLAYPDWVQPLGGSNYVVVTGGSREAHDAKTPVTFTIPDSPTAADPPRRAAVQALRIPGKTSLLSVATSVSGTTATVTAPVQGGFDAITVDGTFGVQRNGPVSLEPAVGRATAVVPTPDGKVAGALVLTSPGDAFAAGRLYLEDAAGSHDLGPIAPLLTDDYSLADRDYYSHVDVSTLIGQPAGLP